MIVSTAEAYSDGARQRLLFDRVEETSMDGMTASAIAICFLQVSNMLSVGGAREPRDHVSGLPFGLNKGIIEKYEPG